MSTQVNATIAIGGENLIDSVNSVTPSGDALRNDNLGGSPYNVSVALAGRECSHTISRLFPTIPLARGLART